MLCAAMAVAKSLSHHLPVAPLFCSSTLAPGNTVLELGSRRAPLVPVKGREEGVLPGFRRDVGRQDVEKDGKKTRDSRVGASPFWFLFSPVEYRQQAAEAQWGASSRASGLF